MLKNESKKDNLSNITVNNKDVPNTKNIVDAFTKVFRSLRTGLSKTSPALILFLNSYSVNSFVLMPGFIYKLNNQKKLKI